MRGTCSIRPAAGEADLRCVRQLFEEYAGELDFPLDFQDFEMELADLPGDYAPPGGCILLAYRRNRKVGCVALRPLYEETCEMKRLYLRPGSRGQGLGRRLAAVALDAARGMGYRWIRLDTVASMRAANRLYESLGFREIAPYRPNPLSGAQFLELDLASSGEE